MKQIAKLKIWQLKNDVLKRRAILLFVQRAIQRARIIHFEFKKFGSFESNCIYIEVAPNYVKMVGLGMSLGAASERSQVPRAARALTPLHREPFVFFRPTATGKTVNSETVLGENSICVFIAGDGSSISVFHRRLGKRRRNNMITLQARLFYIFWFLKTTPRLKRPIDHLLHPPEGGGFPIDLARWCRWANTRPLVECRILSNYFIRYILYMFIRWLE